MFIPLMMGWWYGRGWLWLGSKIYGTLGSINQDFSVPTLIRTLFAPWKQIRTQVSFNNFLQASVDNIVSRLIGASVRSLMLIAALISNLIILLSGLLALLAWPLIPLLLIYLPFLGFTYDF